MRILSTKRLYLPALSIVAVVFLLLVLISISTYRNLDREKTMALHFLYRQGMTVLLSIEAGARAWMMLPMWQDDSIGSLIRETGKNVDIAYVYLMDQNGNVVHHSSPDQRVDPSIGKPEFKNDSGVITRIKKVPGDIQVYELTKIFSPLPTPDSIEAIPSAHEHGDIVKPHLHRGDIIVLGMEMTAYEEARRSDLQHAIIMGIILITLGAGALFFIFVIQNYYLVGKTLEQTEDYTRQVVASMANGLLSIDAEGKIVSFNQLALELLSLQESEVRGLNLNTIINFQASGIDQILTHARPIIDCEIQHRSRANEMIPLSLSATPILDESDQCNGAVIVLRDLREIKQLEAKVRRAEKLAAIGKLAAGVAHEIRNPLSSIRGFAQFLSKGLKNSPKEQEFANTMVAEVDRINRVVTDLLTFATPTTAEPVPADVTELVEHCVRLVQADADSRNIILRRNITDLSKVRLDTNQITQALLNLLLNAMQAVESGGTIEIGAALKPSEARLEIWVEDNSNGIEHNTLDKIFDPFYTTRAKGTGLGLPIVHKIAENHQGEIRVESPPAGKRKGCRFTLSLPTSA
ncbi:nitrogen regulation protein NR(II) [Thermodesulfobacteriota bacterium]